jgi:starvation-inducible outer membrane lipoprotein
MSKLILLTLCLLLSGCVTQKNYDNELMLLAIADNQIMSSNFQNSSEISKLKVRILDIERKENVRGEN